MGQEERQQVARLAQLPFRILASRDSQTFILGGVPREEAMLSFMFRENLKGGVATRADGQKERRI